MKWVGCNSDEFLLFLQKIIYHLKFSYNTNIKLLLIITLKLHKMNLNKWIRNFKFFLIKTFNNMVAFKKKSVEIIWILIPLLLIELIKNNIKTMSFPEEVSVPSL